jgi:hypothetical protein
MQVHHESKTVNKVTSISSNTKCALRIHIKQKMHNINNRMQVGTYTTRNRKTQWNKTSIVKSIKHA